MQLRNFTARDEYGNVIASPTISVKVAGTNTNASLFADVAGATPKANPFTGGADGTYAFATANGIVDITITSPSGLTVTMQDEQFADVLDFDPQTIVDEAIAAHVSEADPHSQYLLESVATTTYASSAFTRVLVSGQNTVSADSISDGLTFTAGSGITITTDSTADSVTVTNSDRGSTAVATHEAAVDPHPQYTTGAEASAAASAAVSAHVGESDPHTQYALESTIGAANGIAPLGADSKVAAIYLPSYVDDVLEFANLAAFPVTGETGKIYVALDTNKTYRWSGSAYVEISPSPGTTDDVVEGATNLYFTNERAQDAAASMLTGASHDGVSVSYSDGSNTLAITNTDKGSTAVTSHEAAVDPHPQYLTQTEGDARYPQAGFTTFAVSGQSNVVADTVSDTLTFVAGSNVTITTSAASDSITISAGGGSGGGGASITVEDEGTPLTTSLAVLDFVGAGVVATNSGDTVTVTIDGYTDEQARDASAAMFTGATHDGVSVSYSDASDTLAITNTDKGSAQAIFRTIAVSGQNSVIADANNDTLTFGAGDGISITTDSSADSITITNSDRGSTAVSTHVGESDPHTQYQLESATAEAAQDAINAALTAGTHDGIAFSYSDASDSLSLTNTDKGSSQAIFKNVAVSGQNTVVADGNNDTLTLVAGTNIAITTDSSADSITITGTGPSSTFGTVAVSGQDNVVADAANDTITFAAGSGIALTTNSTTDTITVAATGPTVGFTTIAVSGQSDVVADSASDTLTFVAGAGVTLTTSAASDSITIASAAGAGATTLGKATDQNKSNNATLGFDTDLQFTAAANGVYRVVVQASLVATDPGYAKHRLSGPSDCVFEGIQYYFRAGTAPAIGGVLRAFATGDTATVVSNNEDTYHIRYEMIVRAVTSGAVGFQWAQDTSSGTASTVKAGSFLEYQKLN